MTEQEAIRPHHRPWRLQRVRSQCRWSEWNFRVLFGWAILSIFSTPEQSGSLRTDGGWILYFTDQAGLWFFGHYWPTAGWTGLDLFLLGCLVWPWRGSCGHAPGAFQRVSLLVGPSGETPVDTEYYQRQVRGRLAGRKANDLILQFPVGAARVQPDWGQGTRIDRHALWVKPGSPWRYRPHPPRGAGEM